MARRRRRGERSQRPANLVPGSECAPKPPGALRPDFAPALQERSPSPVVGGVRRAAPNPERARGSRREKKKSPRTLERRPATPSLPSFSASHRRPTAPRPLGEAAGRAGWGGGRRGGAERAGFGPNCARRGPRGPNSAGSGVGSAGPGPRPAGQATSSPGVPAARPLTRRRRKADLQRPRRRRPRHPRWEEPYKAVARPPLATPAARSRT